MLHTEIDTATVIAKVVVKPAKNKEVKAALLKLALHTKAEEGCINYKLHQDENEENVYFFYENWESEKELQDHTKKENIAEFMKTSSQHLLEFSINNVSIIG